MNDPGNGPRIDRDVVSKRVLGVAVLLSLLTHGIALWEWLPKPRPAPLDAARSADDKAPLSAQLAPRKSVPAAAAAPPSPQPKPVAIAPPKPRPPTRVAKAAPTPAMIMPEVTAPRIPEPALQPPSIAAPAMPAPPAPAPAPTPTPAPRITPPVAQTYPDLSSYIAAQRRARGEAPDAAVEDEVARRDRIVAANLASINTPTFGTEPKNSGGIFQITHLGSDHAEFTFFGWNNDIRRRASQRIEVPRGDERDIRIAVVRKMIAIIRQYEQEDFTWRSNRLGRDIVLSARAADSGGLEDFMLREFF